MYRLLIIFFMFLSCRKEANNAVNYMNVSYGNDSKQKMDIYLPASRNIHETKVIVLIHGGGWTEGDKNDFSDYITGLQEKLPGYAIFNINYRLSNGTINVFPAQENDVLAAIEFIYSNRGEYKISDKFVFLGASAGGHLALLQGYKYNLPVKPKAIVSFFGPADLTALYNSNILATTILLQATGTSPSVNPTIYTQSSPVTFVNTLSAPTLLLHGGADPLVPPSQSVSLQTLLTNAGVTNQYVFYPGEGHGWTGDKLTDSFNKIAAFLNAYVN